jgi:hypothetical protein
MNTTPIGTFHDVRENACDAWIDGTGRIAYLATPHSDLVIDNYNSGYFECRWQIDAGTVMKSKNWHVPHFCSLGDWASNITDMLTDERYDPLSFGQNDAFDLALFRYYTKFLLITSELLLDFAELLHLISGKTPEKCRIELSDSKSTPKININELLKYINSSCKHKILPKNGETKLHACNHHLPFYFEDSPTHGMLKKSVLKNLIRIGATTTILKPVGVLVPKLDYLVTVILHCYQCLDQEYQIGSKPFETFVNVHGAPIP